MVDKNEQRDIDLEYLNYLQEFGKELQSDFEQSKAAEKIKAFAVIPEKLQYYLQQLEALKKEKLEEEADENLVNSEEKKKKEQELITKIAQEFFIFSCASSKSMEESLEFHKNCKLRVQELSNFGENNLSPLAAALLAGKSQQDLNKLIENGAEPNAKNQFGQTAAEMAMMEKGEVKKQQSNSQDDDEERSQRPKAVKRKFTAVKQSSLQEDSSKEDQQREEMQQRQLAEAAVALEMHEVEMMKLLRVAIRKKEALEEVQEQKTATETVEKSSTETHLEKEKQSAENALAKALGLGLGEKIDINKMLFEAVQNGRPMFALLLIRFGADVNHKENGVTILGAAIAGGNNSLISILSDFSNPENRKAALDANRVNEVVLKLVGGAGEVERAVKDVPQLKRDAKMIEEIKDNLRENQKESRQRNLESDVPAIPKVKNNISLNPRPPSPSPEPLEAKLVKAKTIFQGISVP